MSKFDLVYLGDSASYYAERFYKYLCNIKYYCVTSENKISCVKDREPEVYSIFNNLIYYEFDFKIDTNYSVIELIMEYAWADILNKDKSYYLGKDVQKSILNWINNNENSYNILKKFILKYWKNFDLDKYEDTGFIGIANEINA